MFEKPTEQLSELKVDMMDKTSYCNQRRIVLLDDTAKNLKDGEWFPHYCTRHGFRIYGSTTKLSGSRREYEYTDMELGNWEFSVEV